jgi:hypothetical protein
MCAEQNPMIGTRSLDTFVQDMRYAVRNLWASPLFAAIALLTLAIGIGATTAIFSAVNATLLRPLPFPHSDELYSVRSRLLDGRVTGGNLSALNIGALNDPSLPVVHAAGMSLEPFRCNSDPGRRQTRGSLDQRRHGWFL